MELNNYQKQVMCDLSAYLDCVNRGTNLFSAWREYWFSKDVAVGLGGVPSYNNSIERAPHVCMKVPTGGGKTFMACASVRRIFDALPTGKPQVVAGPQRFHPDTDHPHAIRCESPLPAETGSGFCRACRRVHQGNAAERAELFAGYCAGNADSLRNELWLTAH